MMRFAHDTLGQRVVFAPGSTADALAEELPRLGARPMVIAAETERSLAERLTSDLDIALLHSDVAQHVPEALAERGRTAAASADVDVVVTIGGGSTTGLGKAIALTTGLPILAVPTTYAGSEATNVWGLTRGTEKTTGSDPRVLPRTVIYDAELTLTLPRELTIASGLNAVAHCVDSMWAPRADPINRALASDGLRALGTGLRAMTVDLSDIAGRELMLYGCYLAAVAFASAGSGLHHKICHVLGGKYDLPHAQTHAAVLPYVLAYNAPASPDSAARVAAALGGESATESLDRLYLDLGVLPNLGELGMTVDDVESATQSVMAHLPANNPREIHTADIEELLRQAVNGAERTHR
jgi:alcohol dehydrogenase class IV